jgi:hypothetical protein
MLVFLGQRSLMFQSLVLGISLKVSFSIYESVHLCFWLLIYTC